MIWDRGFSSDVSFQLVTSQNRKYNVLPKEEVPSIQLDGCVLI